MTSWIDTARQDDCEGTREVALNVERRPQVVLVRHGETEWSKSGRHTSSSDIPLTEAGRSAAEELGKRLRHWRFELVLTSPLSRAAETCRRAGLGDDAEERGELVEWNYGEYEGLTTPQIRETFPDWSVWRDGCPGGETADEVGARVDPLIAELRALPGDAALFAHGHLLRVLTARWIGLRPNMGAAFALSTTAVSVLGYERETPVIWLWNDVGRGD
jgi:broad specificity phosphatase PhoE